MVHAPEDLGPLGDVGGGHLTGCRGSGRAAGIRLVGVDTLIVGAQETVTKQVVHVHHLRERQEKTMRANTTITCHVRCFHPLFMLQCKAGIGTNTQTL